MEGWRTWTMEIEIIMVYRFYGDGDHHEKQAILCHNCVIAIPIVLLLCMLDSWK